MILSEARELSRRTNSAWVGGVLRDTYVESVERGTLDWDHLELDNGGTYLESALTGVYQGDRW